MRRLGFVVRVVALATVGVLFWLMVGLEAVYLWWLPRERPVRAARHLPPLVRDALWADLGGKGRPHLEPQIPFLVPVVLKASRRDPSSQLTPAFVVSRNALPRMRHLEFQARWIALETWVSRHWTIVDVLDAVGSQTWMDSAGRGFEQAAAYYWDRPLDALAPHEVATLMAVMASPRALDPACHPERALSRRAMVLERMRYAGVIDENAFRDAMGAPLRVRLACDRAPEAQVGRADTRASPCHP